MTTTISAQMTSRGLLIPTTAILDWPPTSPPLTDQERAELAQKFGVGRPLSEIIIEERGESGCAHLSGRR
jgi:hypothetical protein